MLDKMACAENGTVSTYSFLAEKYGTATITPEQLASEYHSHPTRVRRLCAEGAIRAVKVGGKRWAIPIASAADFLDGVTA